MSQKNKELSALANRIEGAVRQYPALAENAKISFVNSYVATSALDKNWKGNLQAQDTDGGFYAERAIKSALFNSYKAKSNTYPVIVLVTYDIRNAILDKDFSDWKFAFPEKDLFYNLKADGALEPHSLTSKPAEALPDTIPLTFNYQVLEYRSKDNTVAYLPSNNEPEVVLKSDIFETNESEIREKDWASALTLHGKWTSQTLHPETSDREWLELVKYSFISKVMTPVTSYLVVENEAQKAILKKKQEQILSSNKSLDPGEDIDRMSEPSWILVLILMGAGWWWHRRRYSLLKDRILFIYILRASARDSQGTDNRRSLNMKDAIHYLLTISAIIPAFTLMGMTLVFLPNLFSDLDQETLPFLATSVLGIGGFAGLLMALLSFHERKPRLVLAFLMSGLTAFLWFISLYGERAWEWIIKIEEPITWFIFVWPTFVSLVYVGIILIRLFRGGREEAEGN